MKYRSRSRGSWDAVDRPPLMIISSIISVALIVCEKWTKTQKVNFRLTLLLDYEI